jgi:hypothetical protein
MAGNQASRPSLTGGRMRQICGCMPAAGRVYAERPPSQTVPTVPSTVQIAHTPAIDSRARLAGAGRRERGGGGRYGGLPAAPGHTPRALPSSSRLAVPPARATALPPSLSAARHRRRPGRAAGARSAGGGASPAQHGGLHPPGPLGGRQADRPPR